MQVLAMVDENAAGEHHGTGHWQIKARRLIMPGTGNKWTK